MDGMNPPAMTPPAIPLRDGDVWLSLPERGDVESVVQHARHPDMEKTYWLPGRPAVTRAAAEALVEELRRGWGGSGRHGAALFIRRLDELVGVVYLRIGSTGVELGYGVAPQFRNQGFATRATRLVTEWLASTGERRRLSIRTSPTNPASCRVAEKLGFVPMRFVKEPTETDEEGLETVYEWPVESGD
jgi:RimJ/RimL family protein N-acetyltransferase